VIPFNSEVQWILGRPNFWCGPIAHQLVRLGHTIPQKAEAEQAYVLHWLLELYEKHGLRFRIEANKILEGSQSAAPASRATMTGDAKP
jgi:hypothetical protein